MFKVLAVILVVLVLGNIGAAAWGHIVHKDVTEGMPIGIGISVGCAVSAICVLVVALAGM